MNLLGMPNPAARSHLGGVATFSKMPPKEVASQLNGQGKEGMGGREEEKRREWREKKKSWLFLLFHLRSLHLVLTAVHPSVD